MNFKLPMDPNLALVSIERLQQEIFRRCITCVIITATIEDPGQPMVRLCYKGGAIGAMGLASYAGDKLREILDGPEEII